MKKEDKSCIDCGKKGVKERHRCEECAKIYNRIRVKKYGRHYKKGICEYCNKEMKVWRKSQKFHKKCYDSFIAEHAKARNNTSGHYNARKKAKELGICVDNYHCIHHINENPDDNRLENLIYMSKKAHNQLHGFLRHHRSLWLKNQSSYSEDCWDTLRDHLTTAWLETTSAKVQKLSDIGQSAAEPLSSDE
jgi:hypothetical protein